MFDTCIRTVPKKYNWTLFALGPGHGIELRNGRFVIPVWLANGEGNHHFPSQVGTLVSDDGGKTWHAGDIIQVSENPADPFACPNETQAVELSDGSVLFNMRHSGSHHVRYISVSPNGKDHFSPPVPTQLFLIPCASAALYAQTNLDKFCL